jgi:Holliday junction resolvase
MRERNVERRLVQRVTEAGGAAIKLAPTVAGLPDRLVLLPGGRTLLVELKAPGGKLRPVQAAMHERLFALGHEVVVLSSVEEVNRFDF